MRTRAQPELLADWPDDGPADDGLDYDGPGDGGLPDEDSEQEWPDEEDEEEAVDWPGDDEPAEGWPDDAPGEGWPDEDARDDGPQVTMLDDGPQVTRLRADRGRAGRPAADDRGPDTPAGSRRPADGRSAGSQRAGGRSADPRRAGRPDPGRRFADSLRAKRGDADPRPGDSRRADRWDAAGRPAGRRPADRRRPAGRKFDYARPAEARPATDWSAAGRRASRGYADRQDAGRRGSDSPGTATPWRRERGADQRTDRLISRGRRSAYHHGSARRRKLVLTAAVVATLGALVAGLLARPGPSWPASVATVQAEITRACQNADVASEPGRVNFACGPSTRQVLWVFALLTSGDNPGFTDTATGRQGLEPIKPVQGGVVAWSLNLHHPYNPANPIDSLEVAARAVNNIVGGATLVNASGNPVIEPGLEGNPANCLRYTGSAALTTRQGFPGLCARPIRGPAGEAALVSDLFTKWFGGGSARTAADAAVLFENANDPGNPQVQEILKRLP